MKYLLLVCLIGFAVVKAQSDDISNALDSLPPELQGKVTEDQVSAVKNQSLQVFKQMCDKNGGSNAFENVLMEFRNFTSCIQQLVDRSVMDKEIEDAKTNGTVDEVFKKYCDKTPEFKKCFYRLTDTAKTCVGEKEREHLKTVYNVTEQLAQFVCFKNGDRIALFYAEGGPECLQSKQEGIQACTNQTFASELEGVNTNELTSDTISQLPTLTFDEHQCRKLSQLQKCVVAQLETCEQPTSANIIESLFKFARKATPCKRFQDVSESRPNAATAAASSAVLLLTMAAALV